VLTLKCDEPLSNVAFKFILRRYTKEMAEYVAATEDEHAPVPMVGPARYCPPRHMMPFKFNRILVLVASAAPSVPCHLLVCLVGIARLVIIGYHLSKKTRVKDVCR
jgi:hypothetical protein